MSTADRNKWDQHYQEEHTHTQLSGTFLKQQLLHLKPGSIRSSLWAGRNSILAQNGFFVDTVDMSSGLEARKNEALGRIDFDKPVYWMAGN